MIRSIRFGLLVAIIASCATHNSASEKVERAIEAHGGYTAFQEIENFRYLKRTYSINDEGIVTDTLAQFLYHESVNHTQLQYQRSDTLFVAEDREGIISLTINDLPIKDPNTLNSQRKLIEAANYIFFQPFKLRDPNAVLNPAGLKRLNLSGKLKEVEVIAVAYPDSDDKWYFFFDPKTHKVVANAVNHNGKMSLITNDAMQWYQGLLVHKTRTSYLSNADFELIRPQASYEYEMVSE
jgi:hypothetical protein